MVLLVLTAVLMAGSAAAGATFAGAATGPTAKRAPSTVKHLCDRPDRPGLMACLALERTDTTRHNGLLKANPEGWGPADLQSAYALPGSTAGAGQTVAIVDAYDDPAAEADLSVYRAQFGLPPCTTASGCFRKVDQRGRTGRPPRPNEGWAGEIALDLEMVSAVCPRCSILLVESDSASSPDMIAATRTAVASGAGFLSLSWGGKEAVDDVYTDADVFHQPGVAIAVSSGDYGYGVGYPASSPYVTAVGGTSLSRTTTGRKWAEKAWDGAGSGCAGYAAKPVFQRDKLCAGRTEADVSAVADPATGVAVYHTYGADGWKVMGGTSASAPIIAGVYALAGRLPAGSAANALPYRAPSALNDVTAGANGACTTALCRAGSGYDGPTGLGTPQGVAGFAATGHGTVAGTVTDTGHKPQPNITVSAGPASVRTDKQGRFLLAVPAGSYDVTAAGWGFVVNKVRATVTANGSTTADIAVTAAKRITISGRLLDGSGHGWPLGGQIAAVDDVDGPRVGGYLPADMITGKYQLDAYQGQHLTLYTAVRGPSVYAPDTVQITVGAKNVSMDRRMKVDQLCLAVGYVDNGDGCKPVPGGLVAGYVRDANTGATLDGAYAVPADGEWSSPSGTTMSEPVAAEAGFYQLFRKAGAVTVTGTRTDYGRQSANVTVRQDATARADFRLDAARLTVSAAAVTRTVPAGGQATATVTVRNTGHVPTSIGLVERNDAPQPAAGAPQAVTGATRQVPGRLTAGRPVVGAAASTGSDWRVIPDNPVPVAAAAAGTDNGKVYVVGGQVGGAVVEVASVYDPKLGAWGPLPPMAAPRAWPAAGFIGGKLYVAGGSDGFSYQNTVEVYDPATKAWSAGRSAPEPLTGVTGAVAGGRLYAGACSDAGCSGPTRMYAYQPSTGTWTRVADYPLATERMACAGIAGKLYCAGGFVNSDVTAKGYTFDPKVNTWSPIPDMPTGLARTAYFAANGKLVVAGGIVSDGAVTSTFAYDPVARTWSKLPDRKAALHESAGACGGYAVGGHRNHSSDTAASAETLPGYDRCGTEGDTNVPWLTAKTSGTVIEPGGSVTVTVNLDATGTAAGTYPAALAVRADTPYPITPIGIRLTVTDGS
jgi:hypothetical protein